MGGKKTKNPWSHSSLILLSCSSPHTTRRPVPFFFPDDLSDVTLSISLLPVARYPPSLPLFDCSPLYHVAHKASCHRRAWGPHRSPPGVLEPRHLTADSFTPL
ncbi:unnamed protein product [Citrullus colocynthis]|uniref:Uncharacterized protein n=1 Tax=Citrullus colocynthis TaxID=252529 RepID=A0ABP0YQS1_9ROSI